MLSFMDVGCNPNCSKSAQASYRKIFKKMLFFVGDETHFQQHCCVVI